MARIRILRLFRFPSPGVFRRVGTGLPFSVRSRRTVLGYLGDIGDAAGIAASP